MRSASLSAVSAPYIWTGTVAPSHPSPDARLGLNSDMVIRGVRCLTVSHPQNLQPGPSDGQATGRVPSLTVRPWRVSMQARDADEEHRASTPLELLFDLTFVVAVSLAASELAREVAEARVVAGLLGYLTVFFAIWWAWVNFTWFASAYDTDDTPYRLLTMVQMGGVLVLAAGVPAAFADANFATVTVGYAIMRVAMVAQWLRAGAGDRQGRRTCRRYASGIATLEVLWLFRLLLPGGFLLPSFLFLVLAEISVPLWAERTGGTRWHPHHIAERYGLFTIILLGESVLAATTAVQLGLSEHGLTAALVAVSIAALLLLFGLWWLYFLRSTGAGLATHRDRAFVWGYGHFAMFAALAALGAGLEVAAEAVTGPVAAGDVVVSLAVAVPVAVYLLLLTPLHGALWDEAATGSPEMRVAAGGVLALGCAPAAGVPLALSVLLLSLPVALLVAVKVAEAHRAALG